VKVAVKVAGEASEAEVPLRARAKRKVFSRLAASKPPLSPSHFYQKICHPSGACSRPPPTLLSF